MGDVQRMDDDRVNLEEDVYEEWVRDHGGRETARPFLPTPARRVRQPIETIRAPLRSVLVTMRCTQIYTLDPVTHQPDFVKAKITYQPRGRLIDSKSMHAYIVALGPPQVGYSMERLATILATDVWHAALPEWVRVKVREKRRGGIAIIAQCTIDTEDP